MTTVTADTAPSLDKVHAYLSETYANKKTFPTAKEAAAVMGVSLQTMQHAIKHHRAVLGIKPVKGKPVESRPRENSRTMQIAKFIYTCQKDKGETPEIKDIVDHFSSPGDPCTAQVVRNALAYLQKRNVLARAKIRWTFMDDFESQDVGDGYDVDEVVTCDDD